MSVPSSGGVRGGAWRIAAAHVALALSGAAGLVYETVWSRLLLRIFGVGELANATVLVAYFLGLGLGAALGDRLVVRVRRPARGYAAVEVGAALFAVCAGPLMGALRGAYVHLGGGLSFGALSVLRLALALAALLPPTVLLGATLPLVVSSLRTEAPGSWAATASNLYVSNTLGGVLGTALTGFFLVPRLGMRATSFVAASCSVLAAGLLWAAYGAVERAPGALEQGAPSAEGEAPAVATARGSFAALAALAAMAGFSALASEVVWTRALRVALDGTTTTFAAMLSVFLSGIVLAGLLARALVRRGLDPLATFGVAQLAACGATVGSMLLVRRLPQAMALAAHSTDLPPPSVGTVLAVAVVLLLPLSVATGVSVPLLWQACASATERGSRVGRVLAANTAGGLFGALCAGFVLVPTVGIDGSLVALCLVTLACGGVALRVAWASASRARRALALAVPLAAAAGVALASPSVALPYLLFARSGGGEALLRGPTWSPPLAFLREGRNTTVTLRVDTATGFVQLANDGRPESGISTGPVGFGPELLLLGSLPAAFAERLDRAMVIGLGGGHTTAVLLAGGFARVDAVELEAGVVDAARALYQARGLRFPLDDPRATITLDDARARLLLAPPASYDAIVSQPSHPWLQGSSALYTKEFFAEARRALRPGGVLLIWANLFRNDVAHLRMVVRTLRTEFPEVAGFVGEGSSLVLCASAGPLRVDARLRERLRAPALRAYLEAHRLASAHELLARVEFDPTASARFSDGAAVLSDDRPLLEFDLAAIPDRTVVRAREFDSEMRAVPWAQGAFWQGISEAEWPDVVAARARVVHARSAGLERLARSRATVARAADAEALLRAAEASHRAALDDELIALDASEHALAVERAQALRLEEGRLAELLERASAPRRGGTATAVLAAAAGLGDAPSAQRALSIAAPAGAQPQPLESALRDAVRALADGGCERVAALPPPAVDEVGPTRVYYETLRRRCAESSGANAAGISLFVQREAAARRAWASSLLTLARASDGNVGAALLERRYRAALRQNAILVPAAVGLASVLVRTGRRPEAEALMRDTHALTDGLESTRASLREGAMGLRLPLPDSDRGAPTAPPALGRESAPPEG